MKIVEPFRDKKQIDAMKAILSSGKMGQRNVLLFSIGINTAYRISDLRRLKLSDVLTISRDRVIAKDRLEMKEQKTGKHNSIIISNKLRKLIMEYCTEVFSYEIANREFDHYLFPSQKGTDEPMKRQTLWEILSNAAKSIGVSNIGSHSMRKTFGYFLYKNGTSIEIIQDLLNHSSQRETLRYIGITQEDKDTAVISLDL
ncbi:recombinase [Enterococcus plantarum]|uniref:tyrosine-type recombinase/integrase n=1 Tax=Enterococcus plantarum TaxID=1077675 RepID=UPI00084D052C|nr:tyrosine-type recombinase/integrase [Enterococcus plantarum]OEG20034.1 recombinase [Enterococcus plantarum]